MKCSKCGSTSVEILQIYDNINKCDAIIVSCQCGYELEFYPVIERYKGKTNILNKELTLVV